MLKFFLSVIAIATCILSFAQEKINVHVRTEENGRAIEMAYVNVYSANPRRLQSSVMSDENGNAVLSVDNYPSEIEVIAIGYDPGYSKLYSAVSDLNFSLIKRFSSLNEVVITGVPKPTKPKDALSLYKTISAATIKSLGAVTLDQAIANQLNITISNDDVLGSKMRMQGLSGDKVKILIDGMPVNGREASNIDLSQINLYNAERIEIVQGPMSVMYGTDALGGVINLITKNNKKPWELNANAYYETVGKYNFNISGTKSWKRHSVTLGGGRNYSDGWKYLDTIAPHRFLLFKPKEQYIGNLNYSYTAPSGFKIRLASDFVKEKITNKGIATITPYEGYAFDDYYKTKRSMNRLLLEGKLGKQAHWQMMNGFSYYYRNKNTYRRDLVSLNQSSVSGMQDTSSYDEFLSRGNYDSKFLKLDFTLGYDINIQTGKSSEKIPGGYKRMDDYALFGTIGLPVIKDKLIAQLGIRVEHNTEYKSPATPAFNILYHASKKIQVRGSYARGFRAPTLKELYLVFIDQNHHVIGSPSLKAEESDHVQLSLSYQLPVKQQSNYTQFLLTGYFNNVKEGIALSPDNPYDPNSPDYTYRNIERQRNAIGSIELEGQQNNFHYKLGYSFTYMFEEKEQYNSFDTHEMSASIQYYWRAPKLSFSIFDKFTGSQPFLRGNIDGSATYDGRQPSFNMMDFSAEKKLFRNKIQLIVGVKNIFDVQQLSSSGISTGGIHSGNGSINFLPRSLFTSLNVTLD